MRVIVCGGRYYIDYKTLCIVLNEIHAESTITCVVYGGATGADKLAMCWAVSNGIQHESHPANWKEYGKSAGPRRNREMSSSGADLCVAFPGGRGTEDMIRCAKRAGIKVTTINNDGEMTNG
jgi:predicted Rossmann-fold nucleotide-binding protein